MIRYIFYVLTFIHLGCTSTPKTIVDDPDENLQGVSLEEYCVTHQCRKNQVINFLTDGDPVNDILELYWPVVQGEKLSLLPGEKVFIEADIVEGLYTNLKQVDSVINKDKTIVFDFSQMEGNVDMMLSVKNPFDKAIKYHIDMIDFEGNPHQTTSCPVIPNGAVYEAWPHPIPEIIISNIRAIELSDSVSCIY